MNSYNGFTPNQRGKALKWFNEQIKQGHRQKIPKKCDICGQEQGHKEFHSENYSEPFGDHIGGFGLCYICHMMLHCRFRNPEKWNIYKETLGERIRYAALSSRNWILFKKQFLEGSGIKGFVEPSDGNNLEIIRNIESGFYLKY